MSLPYLFKLFLQYFHRFCLFILLTCAKCKIIGRNVVVPKKLFQFPSFALSKQILLSSFVPTAIDDTDARKCIKMHSTQRRIISLLWILSRATSFYLKLWQNEDNCVCYVAGCRIGPGKHSSLWFPEWSIPNQLCYTFAGVDRTCRWPIDRRRIGQSNS